MAYRTVCISSEDGTGALGAASLAAEELGLRVVDEDIVTRAAMEADVDPRVVADVEQRKSRLVRLIEGLAPAGMAAGYVIPPQALGEPASDELRGLIRSVIEETAAAGGAMIVSHAASLALGDKTDVLRVLVTASPEVRAKRLEESLSVPSNEAEGLIKRGDAGRADYIKRFYGIGDERPIHYDLTLNTDRLSAQGAAKLIVVAFHGA